MYKTKIADLVQITPAEFHKKSVHAVEDNINAKYANKVSHITLCPQLTMTIWTPIHAFPDQNHH